MYVSVEVGMGICNVTKLSLNVGIGMYLYS